MGNRAVIAFHEKDQRPEVAVYMHWNGGPASVYAILDVMAEHRGFAHSAGYSTARFAHLACELVGHDGHSVGIERFTQIADMAGMGEDNGLYLVNVSDRTVTRYMPKDGRACKATAAAVDAERIACNSHAYWKDDGIRAKLRAALVVEKVAA